MEEWIKKSDVLELLGLPSDILYEHIYELKGVWVDKDWTNDKWTPCSEGLPKEDGTYLCQIDCGHCELISTLDFSTNLYNVSKYEFYDKRRPGFYDSDGEWGRYEVDNVVAWQSLPTLYKKK